MNLYRDFGKCNLDRGSLRDLVYGNTHYVKIARVTRMHLPITMYSNKTKRGKNSLLVKISLRFVIVFENFILFKFYYHSFFYYAVEIYP